jgi:hypothetical protein
MQQPDLRLKIRLVSNIFSDIFSPPRGDSQVLAHPPFSNHYFIEIFPYFR